MSGVLSEASAFLEEEEPASRFFDMFGALLYLSCYAGNQIHNESSVIPVLE